MSKPLNVLIVDDHPLIVKAYQSAVKHVGKKRSCQFHIETADSCDTAQEAINKYTEEEPLEMAFLDISLPPSKDGEIVSGEDLGTLIREVSPNTKIIVSTTFTRNARLNSILKSIDPDGFLIKNDLTPEVLTEAIESVLEDDPYYCKTVLKFLRRKSTADFVLDRTDRKMLFELSRGAKMKDLPEMLNLSIAAIERRKRILKEEFHVGGKGDRELLQAAEDSGFI